MGETIHVLGRKRRIRIVNNKKYVMYKKSLIPLTDAMKLDKKVGGGNCLCKSRNSIYAEPRPQDQPVVTVTGIVNASNNIENANVHVNGQVIPILNNMGWNAVFEMIRTRIEQIGRDRQTHTTFSAQLAGTVAGNGMPQGQMDFVEMTFGDIVCNTCTSFFCNCS